ncbi:MAG: 4-hydroxythreonine-4-phosphate dehydrogenase PdxA [Saccharofermentanales bacterium]
MLPVIGVPVGDPAGIGPEIAIKAALSDEMKSSAHIILIGAEDVFRHVKSHFDFAYDDLDIHLIKNLCGSLGPHGPFGPCEFGKIQANCGRIAYDSIREAVRMALNNDIDAIATTPVNKEAFRMAKIDSIGHTELLGELTGTDDPVTMFDTNGMRIFFLTRHLSLMKACESISYDKVLSGIIRTYESLLLLGENKSGKQLPFAVAGLNPHNGEHGLFGSEEEDFIRPAVDKARELGIPVEGPVPADSVFYQARTGKFSAVLSLYHDQGHIAAKTYDFEKTISMTLGLPFLRTSVDHGTAFDIAGRGIAQYVSMIQAISIAARYAGIYKDNYTKIIKSLK